MTTYNDNNNNNECPLPPPEAEEVPKRKVGRPRRDPNTVMTAQPDYFRKFYHEKRTVKIPCAVCSQLISKNSYSAHKKSMKCRLVGLQNEKTEI